MGFWRRLTHRASPVRTTNTGGASHSSVPDTPKATSLRPVPLPGDGRQTVVGERYHRRELRAITRGVHLPKLTGSNWHEAVSMTAQLRPEPTNSHDPNAVRVEIDGKLVGYIPAQDAPAYQPHLLTLAEAGEIGTCESRLMRGKDGEVVVYLHLGSPEALDFMVHAPEGTVPLSPTRITTVTGEEDHQDILHQIAPARTGVESWETASLGFYTIPKGKFAGQQAIEVCLRGTAIGQLTRGKSEQYKEFVHKALDAGKTPICRARLSLTRDRGVQVEVMMPEVKRHAKERPTAVSSPA